MSSLRKSGLLALLAAAVMACAAATPASATTLDGGAFTMTSTNLVWTFHWGVSISCTSNTISGTTPSGTATTLSVPVTLSYGGCNLSGTPTLVTPSEGCGTAATTPRLDIMQNQVTAPQASVQITLPAGCNLVLSIPAAACSITVTGGQTIGNGAATGAGSIGWSNSSLKSTFAMTQALVPDVDSSGGSPLCGGVGTNSGTLSGIYVVSSATNVTVTP
jgi:hypothetical protein